MFPDTTQYVARGLFTRPLQQERHCPPGLPVALRARVGYGPNKTLNRIPHWQAAEAANSVDRGMLYAGSPAHSNR